MLPTRTLEALEHDLGEDRAIGNIVADRGYDDGCAWALTLATERQLQELAAAVGHFGTDGTPAPSFVKTVSSLLGDLLRANGFQGTLAESQSLHYWTGFAAGAMDVYERTPDSRREDD